MFKTKSFKVINQKKRIYILTDGIVFAFCLFAFLSLFFSVFDKEYTAEIVKRGVIGGAAAGLVILLLRRHPLISPGVLIVCFLGMVFINFDIFRESCIQIANFARTRSYFELDTAVYSAFLSAAFFVFCLLLAFFQNLRLSLLPMLGFLGAVTAYIVILNKPYDTGIYIMYIIITLSLALYCLSAKASPFMGFVVFGAAGLVSVLIVSHMGSYLNQESYEDLREQNDILKSFDATSFVEKVYPDLNVTALTEGQLLTFIPDGSIKQKLMAVLTVSEFENDFCLKSYTGDKYSEGNWRKLNDNEKNKLPEGKPEEILNDIIKADYGSQALLFDYNIIDYTLEKESTVKSVFLPYFLYEFKDYAISGSFFEPKAKLATIYDTTEETVENALKAELSEEEAKGLLNREKKYRDFVYENYLDVPEGLKTRLEADYSSLKETEYTSELLNKLKEEINKNIEFKLNPDPVAAGADPVEFAMDKGEGGVNQIASIGVMALRYLGYPARYAEGIAADADSKEGATTVSNSYKIDIYNTEAAAFAEVYIDGLGWLPVSFLSDNIKELTNSQIEELNDQKAADFSDKLKTTASPYVKSALKVVLKIMAVVLALAVLFEALRIIIIKLVRRLLAGSKNKERSKKALYAYTEKVNAFFGENIFEETAVYEELNRLLYSRKADISAYDVYKKAKALTQKKLKEEKIFKKLSAVLVDVII